MTMPAAQHRSADDADLPPAGHAADAAPGKTTASSTLPADSAHAPARAAALPGGPLPPELADRVGETFVDGGHYVWRIEPDGSFACVAQPPSATRNSVGAKVTAAKGELWTTLCGIAIKELAAAAPAAPASETDAGAGAAAPADGGGFSLTGFFTSLVGAGQAVVDVGSQVTDLVTGAVETIAGAVGSLFGFGGDGQVTEVEPAQDAGGGGGGSADTATDNAEDQETEPTAPPAPANPATPYLVGGYPSSQPASSSKPAYAGGVSTEDAGIPRNHGGVKLTPPLVRTARILAEYVPRGTVITSGWRPDEDQAYIIWDYAGRAAGKGRGEGMLVDNDLWKTKPKAEQYNNPIAWVGSSAHRSGVAMDLAGASLSEIQAAVERCQAERPDAKIVYILPEPKCIHVQVGE